MDRVEIGTFELGAIVRRDGVVVRARLSVHPAGRYVSFVDADGRGPIGNMNAATEGVCWAIGAWDSVDVVALRTLAALEHAR